MRKGILAAAAAFAASPQGRRLIQQAKAYIRSPQGQRKLAELRERASGRRTDRRGHRTHQHHPPVTRRR